MSSRRSTGRYKNCEYIHIIDWVEGGFSRVFDQSRDLYSGHGSANGILMAVQLRLISFEPCRVSYTQIKFDLPTFILWWRNDMARLCLLARRFEYSDGKWRHIAGVQNNWISGAPKDPAGAIKDDTHRAPGERVLTKIMRTNSHERRRRPENVYPLDDFPDWPARRQRVVRCDRISVSISAGERGQQRLRRLRWFVNTLVINAFISTRSLSNKIISAFIQQKCNVWSLRKSWNLSVWNLLIIKTQR